jgi:ornithine carbamoyltransferase
MKTPHHFLDLDKIDTAILRFILDKSKSLKKNPSYFGENPLKGKTLAMIFEKPSTRTRVSFEVSMAQMGGHSIILTPNDTQLGRGETIADTARVLSRYVNAIMIRTDLEQKLIEMAENSSIPVINGLTNLSHPCQVMADILTFEEHRGTLSGKIVAWCGDGNNVANSWIHASSHFNFILRLACPERLLPPLSLIETARQKGATIEICATPEEAVMKAHCILTDTWISMGCTDTDRAVILAPYQINKKLMSLAHDTVAFMHCLPAHRGEEVTAEVIDSPQSLVWDEVENRLHVQKSILHWCMLS